jgi:predicted transcriptional regulator
MSCERDEETGKYILQYQNQELLDALEEEDFLSTNDVAEKVGYAQNLAYRRLKELQQNE